jgi:hypothetical protein
MANIKGEDEPRIPRLLNQAQALVQSEASSMAELAKALNKPWRQAYMWIIAREFAPKGEIALALREWVDEQIVKLTPAARKKYSAKLREIGRG